MAPGQPYHGPVALAASKYASQVYKNLAATSSAASPVMPAAAAASSSSAESPAVAAAAPVMDTAIAVRQKQPATTDEVAKSPVAQMALDEEVAFEKKVEKSAAKLLDSRSAAENTFQQLPLIREAIKREGTATADEMLPLIDAFEANWKKVSENLVDAENAVSTFLADRKNIVSIAIGSVQDEAYQVVQAELKAQYDKVAIQQGYTIELQRAYANLNTRSVSQLEEQEQLVKTLKEQLAGYLDEIKGLEEQLVHRLGEINSFQEQTARHEQVSSLKQKASKLSMNTGLLRHELTQERQAYKNNMKKLSEQNDGLVDQNKMIRDKYDKQTVEYGRIFGELGDKKKEMEGLRQRILALRGVGDVAKASASRMQEGINNEKTANKKLNEELKRKDLDIDNMNRKLDLAYDSANALQDENANLKTSIKNLENQLEEVKTVSDKFKADNDSLRASIDRLDKQVQGGGPSSENAAPQDQIKELQNQLDEANFRALASYENAKKYYVVSREAKALRDEIANFQEQQTIAKDEIALWRGLYEKLMEDINK